MEPHRLLFDLFAFTIRSPAWETVSIIFRAGARWNRTDFCSICSPSQFVHLHGKPYRLFFERELDGTAPISVRSVRLHNSFTCMGNRIDYFSSGSSMEPHRFLFDLFAFTIRSPAWETVSIIFRAGARWNRTDFCSICSPSQFVHLHGKPYRLFFERELDGTAPTSVRSVRLHNSFTCMGNRIDYFSSRSSMEPHRLLFDLFAFTIRSPAWETVSIIFRAGARWNRSDFCSICSPSQFVHLHGKPYRLFFEQELDGTAPISVRSVRLHNSFTCMGNRIDYFSSGSSMEPHRYLYE